jgi:hypothetical protein
MHHAKSGPLQKRGAKGVKGHEARDIGSNFPAVLCLYTDGEICILLFFANTDIQIFIPERSETNA